MIVLFVAAVSFYLLNFVAAAPKLSTFDALKIVDVSQECQYTLHNGERDAPLIKVAARRNAAQCKMLFFQEIIHNYS